MKYYIVQNGFELTVIGTRGSAPKTYLAEAPKDEAGKYIKDLALIRIDDIQPMVDRPKQAVDVDGFYIFETLQRETYDMQGQPILDENSDPVLEDYQSKVIELDENGDPVMEAVPFGDTYKLAVVDDTLKTARILELASEKEDGKWEALRLERDSKLAASDFSQLVDAPLTAEKKTEWKNYRGALRDIPANTADPLSPAWPVKPL